MANQRGLENEVALSVEIQQLMRAHFEDETTQAYQDMQEFERLQKDITRDNEELFSQAERLQQILLETRSQLKFYDDTIEENNQEIKKSQNSIATLTRASQQLEIQSAERILVTSLRAAINNSLTKYNSDNETFFRILPSPKVSDLLHDLNVIMNDMGRNNYKAFYNKYLGPEIRKSFPQFGIQPPFYLSEGKGRPAALKMVIEDHRVDIQFARKILPKDAKPDQHLKERIEAYEKQIENLQNENLRHLLNKRETIKEYKDSFIAGVPLFAEGANKMVKMNFLRDLERYQSEANEILKNIKGIKLNAGLNLEKDAREDSIIKVIEIAIERGKNVVVDDNFTAQKGMIVDVITEQMQRLVSINTKLEKNQKRKQDLRDKANLALAEAEKIPEKMREDLRNTDSLREELAGDWDARLKKYFVDSIIYFEELNQEDEAAQIISPLEELKKDVLAGIGQIKEFVNELDALSITDSEFSIKIKEDKESLERIKKFPHMAYDAYRSQQRRDSNQQLVENAIKPEKDFFNKLQDLINEIKKENEKLNAKGKSSSSWGRYGVSTKSSAMSQALEAAMNNLPSILAAGKENKFSNESELLNNFLNFKKDERTPSIKEALQQKRHGFFSNPKSYERICEKFNISAPDIKNVKKL